MTETEPAAGTPRVALAPSGLRPWLQRTLAASGAQIVDLDDADVLVWTATGFEDEPAARPERLADVVRAHPRLRWVQLPWAGVEVFAEAGVFDHERIWTAGKGVYAEPVAEHALALALAGLRELKRRANARAWGDPGGVSLVGGRVTIFGAGGITRALIDLLAPFGVDVTVVRRHPGPVEGADRVLVFDERYEALSGADVVVLALALTPETTELMGQVEFELMEPHAWLVNVARGQHVVTDDLLIALRGDVIGGAALDVTAPEPLPAGHPLWDLPNCLITPHTANTEDMMIPLLGRRITENIRRFAAGEQLLGVVDADLGY